MKKHGEDKQFKSDFKVYCRREGKKQQTNDKPSAGCVCVKTTQILSAIDLDRKPVSKMVIQRLVKGLIAGPRILQNIYTTLGLQ